MLLSELINRKIAIWGFGIEGKSIYQLLRKNGSENIVVIDTKKPQEKIDFIEENEVLNNLDKFDLIIKCASISIYANKNFTEAIKYREYTTQTNIFFANFLEHKKFYEKPTLIAITGTKGKSTTASLLHHILSGLGYKLKLVGNIGFPMTDIIDELSGLDFIVMELSSYQTADLKYAPDVAIVLNMCPEHIHWHKTHEKYYQDKLHLLELAKKFGKKTFDFRNLEKPQIPFEVKNDYLNFEHNQRNLYCVLEILKFLKIEPSPKMQQVINNFKGLNFRLQIVKEEDGITYVDDSISTIPEAAIAAIKSCKNIPIAMILGGEDRCQNFFELAKFIVSSNKVEFIAILGECKNRIKASLDKAGFTNYVVVDNLTEAVSEVKKSITKGTILLSPAAPSHDQFKNFEERGRLFNKLVV